MTVRHAVFSVLMLIFGTAVASAQPAQTRTQSSPEESAGCPARDVFWICVTKPYQAVIQGVSLSPRNKQADPDAVRKLGVTILSISSDNLVPWNPSPAYKFCAGTGCMYYLKTCYPSQCSYKYGAATPQGVVPYPENMEISYATETALQAAEHNVFLALGPAGNKTLVPLSEVKTGGP
jgi:hypothetical protein